MSWMTGFERGQRIAKGLVDTYQQARQQAEVERIVNDKPVDSTGLSTDQSEQVFQQLANSDATARDVPKEDGSTGVAVTKSLPEGVEGPAQTQTYEPQKITRYLGQDFVGGLDPAKAKSVRNRALAGVLTKSDPLKGIQLDAALTQEERADQDYGDKQQVRTLQQQYTVETDPFKRAEIGRKLAALPGGGDVVKGFGDIEKANFQAVVNHARKLLLKGDVVGAMNVYNQYDNGEDGEVVQLPGGGYKLNFYQGKPGDGKLTGSKTFKSGDELTTWFDDQFDPEAATKRRAEAATSQRKFSMELAKAVAIEQAKGAVRESMLRPGFEWDVDADGNEIQVRVGGGSGSSSGGGKKAPKTSLEQTLDLLGGANDKEPKDEATTPEQVLIASAAAESIHDLNPGIKPGVAAIAARAYAKTSDTQDSLLYGWDPKSGAVVEQVWTPQGVVAVNKVTPFNAPARKLPPDMLRQAVEHSITSLTGGDAAKRQAVIQAATDATGKGRRTLLDGLVSSSLQSDPRFKTLSPEMQARARAIQEKTIDARLGTALSWIKNYGQASAN